MRNSILLAASMLCAASLAAQPAAAQTYHDEHVARQEECQRDKRGNTAGGAIIGGLLGAVLGSQVAADGHRTDGSVLGGVLGAAAGAAIGNSTSDCSNARPHGSYDPYDGRPYRDRQYQSRRHDDDYGLDGGPYEPTDYAYNQRGRASQNCRWGESVTRDPDGFEYTEAVYMCRGRDGVWRAQ